MRLGSAIALGMVVVTASGFASEWSQLPSLPDREGFAGAFAGVASGALIVAGGANIPGEKWGETFAKAWYDDVYLLTTPTAAWRKAGKLPKPTGYGVSITTERGVLCIGGGDAQTNFSDVILITSDDGELKVAQLPPLPKPCAMMCGALLRNVIYVAGGIERPDATAALNTLWALDLSHPRPQWRELDPCPGPERILAAASADDEAFYLFSGARLSRSSDGKAAREYLRDAWRYIPGQGWERLPDLPRPAVAAPSPAPASGGRIYVFSGDDGKNVDFKPVEAHPGFPRDTLIYHVESRSWVSEGGLPFSRATVPVVPWRGAFVLPNGEVRPRFRTPEVWRVSIGSPR